jgi:hypothetical protein
MTDLSSTAVPKRIQRKRTKGWKMPPNTVFVGRGTIWGNPFVIGAPSGCDFNDGGDPSPLIQAMSREQVVEFYENAMSGYLKPEMHPHGHQWVSRFRSRVRGASPPEWARSVLRGKNLACWCAPEDDCHADVLLKIANDRR